MFAYKSTKGFMVPWVLNIQEAGIAVISSVGFILNLRRLILLYVLIYSIGCFRLKEAL